LTFKNYPCGGGLFCSEAYRYHNALLSADTRAYLSAPDSSAAMSRSQHYSTGAQ